MADEIRVNGNLYSWGSLRIKIAGEEYRGFTSINIADKRERVHGYGTGKHHAPRGKSRGKYSVEPIKITGHVDSVQAVRQALADASGTNSYGDTEAEIFLEFGEPGRTPITITAEGCTWAENTGTYEENPDPKMEDFSMLPMRIRRNGLTLFDESEGSP